MNPDLQNYITQSRQQRIRKFVCFFVLFLFILLTPFGVHANSTSLNSNDSQNYAQVVSTTDLQASFWSSIGNFFNQIINRVVPIIVRRFIPTFRLPISESQATPTPQPARTGTQPTNPPTETAPPEATEQPNQSPDITASPAITPTTIPLLSSSPLPTQTTFTVGPEEKYFGACGPSLKYFPTDLVNRFIGPVKGSYVGRSTTNSTLKINSSSCNFYIEYLPKGPGGLATTNVVEYPTIEQARLYIKRVISSRYKSMTVGDEAYYSNNNTLSYARKGRFVFSVDWGCFCAGGQFLSQTQAQTILNYAVGQVPDIQTTSAPQPIAETGTQYLARVFKDTGVTFYGDWPEPAPNREVVNLELEVRKGLAAISGSAYQKLGIKINIYKDNLWKTARAQYCPDNARVIGCSSAGNNIIYETAGADTTTDVDLNNPYSHKSDPLARLILHESAHKLHFSYLNTADYVGTINYLPVPLFLQSQFTKDWSTAYGTVDEKTCKYLPVVALTHWATGSDIPRCGFASAYGAIHYSESSTLKRYLEDIATMTEYLYFEPGTLSQGDGPTDQRYAQKKAILKKYGFL